MIDAAGDLPAILDDCGGAAQTVNGELIGRFLEEPAEVLGGSGIPVLTSEAVFYTSQQSIDAVDLVKGSWLEIDGVRWIAREVPRDDNGLVRIRLSK